MELEHLIKAYKQNEINIEVKDMSNDSERAGVITFEKGISASYLLDNEDIVIAMKIFFNCLANETMKLNAQLNHTIKVLTIMQKTIILLGNIPQKECNMILEALGLFDNTFQKRQENKTFRA